MTALFAMLAPFWGQILGVLGVAGGFLVAWASRKSAATQVAQSQQKLDAKDTKIAQLSQSNAEANAKATQSAVDAAKDRTDVENQIAAAPAGDAARVLHDEWARDN